jgi:hypothetical protein
MTPVNYLRKNGPETALKLAKIFDMTHGEIYTYLVAAESAGLVKLHRRKNIIKNGAGKIFWEKVESQ